MMLAIADFFWIFPLASAQQTAKAKSATVAKSDCRCTPTQPHATTLEFSHATTLEFSRASTLELPRASTLEFSRATTELLPHATTELFPRAFLTTIRSSDLM